MQIISSVVLALCAITQVAQAFPAENGDIVAREPVADVGVEGFVDVEDKKTSTKKHKGHHTKTTTTKKPKKTKTHKGKHTTTKKPKSTKTTATSDILTTITSELSVTAPITTEVPVTVTTSLPVSVGL